MRKLFAAAALAAASLVAAPAGAVDQTKPEVSCFGLLFKDKIGDATSAGPAGDSSYKPDNLDLSEGFLKYDAAQGAEAATINLRVANLHKTIPKGATAIVWQMNYVGSQGTNAWVRAMTDFSGLVSYEYGGLEETPAIPFNVRRGATTGAFFEGKDGIVQIVIPESLEPKGQVLKTFKISTYEAVQTLPGAAPTPVKGGLLYEDDNASGGKTTWTVGQPCPAAAPAAPAAPAELPAAAPAPVTALSSSGPLPVKVTSRRFKAKKVKKGMTIKLKASEPLTKIGAQLKKGKKVVGKGSLAKLNKGKGSLRLKAKRLKKGTYVLDLAGTDATGARRFTAVKISIR